MPCGTRWIPSCARGSAACRIAQLGQPLDVTPGAFLALGQGGAVAEARGVRIIGLVEPAARRTLSSRPKLIRARGDRTQLGLCGPLRGPIERGTRPIGTRSGHLLWHSPQHCIKRQSNEPWRSPRFKEVRRPTRCIICRSCYVLGGTPETGTQPVRPRIDGCANDAWPNIMAPDRNCVPSGSTGCSAVPALAHHRRRGGLRGFIMSSGIRTRDGKVWFARRDEIARHWLDHNGSPS
jgi:hypothetical protein